MRLYLLGARSMFVNLLIDARYRWRKHVLAMQSRGRKFQ